MEECYLALPEFQEWFYEVVLLIRTGLRLS